MPKPPIGTNAAAAKQSQTNDAYQYMTTKNVMGAAQSEKTLRRKIGSIARAKWEQKTGSQAGAETNTMARLARLGGFHKTSNFIDMFLVDAAKQKAKRIAAKRKRGEQLDDDELDEKELKAKQKVQGGGGAGRKTSARMLSTLRSIKKDVGITRITITNMSGQVDDIKDDVKDIKSLIMPKKMAVRGKRYTGSWGENKDEDVGRMDYAQYNPLAPAGSQFLRVKKKYPKGWKKGLYTMGGPSSQPIEKGFQEDAMKKAAMATAILALKIEKKDAEKATIRKKRNWKEPKESDPTVAADPVSLLRVDMNKGFEDINKKLAENQEKLEDEKAGPLSGLADIYAGWKMIKPFLGFLAVIPWGAMAAVGLAAWVGYEIGTWISDNYGDKILDGIFAIQKWWEDLDILGMLKPLTDGIRKVTDFFHITKSEEKLKEEHKKNAAAGRMPGGVASTKGPSMDESIALLDKQAKTAKTPAERAAAANARDVLISQRAQRAAGAPVTPSSTVTSVAPATSGPTSRGGARGSAAPSKPAPAPSKPAVGGTGKLFSKPKTEKGLLMPDSSIKDMILAAADRVGVDQGIMMAMAKQESAFNPNAKAGTSSAKGLYQFLDSTWGDMVKKYGSRYPELNKGQTDPMASALAGALFIKENGEYLKKAGIPVDGTSIYAAHFLGPGGAKQLFSADPNTDAARLMPKPAAANKNIFYNKDGSSRTVGEVQSVLFDKVGKFADMYSDKLQSEKSGRMLASAPSAPSAAGSATPAKGVSGSNVDGASRSLSAANSPSAQVAMVQPVTVNNNTNNTTQKMPPRPMAKASALSEDPSFVRMASKDVQHPAIA